MTDAARDRSHTPTPAVLGALLLASARTTDTTPATTASTEAAAPAGTTVGLDAPDETILAEVEATLSAQFPDDAALVDRTVTEVAEAIGSIRRRDTKPGLTAARYDAERTALLRHLGIGSGKGASLWPPTSQTAVQRFGSWNDALTAAGLATSSTGRAKGQLRFDAAAYDRAIAAFVADCESRGVGATYKEYGEYATAHKGEVPSAAAVRKFYGSWNAALASAT
ncbi:MULTISPECIES: multidrug transporter [unclassified Brevibacterium]|uniref:homing endonuclease associated repeat-containing protein n=1 Tax=unclassified Brevibacterium TaxID=2614124 RepID=UPI00201709E3|nr:MULTISPECIES: multidrug transporter [unclassified Brevibacterium]MCM1013042.1 multidrug transporter [Brevibacterium sp. XM4083]